MNSIISFFTGAGFLDLGFEHAGFRIDMVNEYSAEFLEGYRHSRKMLGSPLPKYGHHHGSIESFNSGEHLERLMLVVRDIQASGRKVGFVGGPPCPDFSIAGKNAGSEGDNGRLTTIYFDLIENARPDFFVFENVQGLWSTKVHRQFYDSMKERLTAMGYTLHDRLVNAICYGVGQDRSRIFLVGVLDGSKGLEFPWDKNMPHTEEMLGRNWPKEEAFKIGSDRPFPEDANFPRELTVAHWFETNRVSEHPNGGMAFKPQSSKFEEIPEGAVKKKSFKRLHRWRYSPTAAYGNNEVHLHPWEARRISVAEALAIQSLPREFELPQDMTLSTCFKTIGNGVPYKAALGLAKSIEAHLAAEDAVTETSDAAGAGDGLPYGALLVAAE